jgi:hypothetical protein
MARVLLYLSEQIASGNLPSVLAIIFTFLFFSTVRATFALQRIKKQRANAAASSQA